MNIHCAIDCILCSGSLGNLFEYRVRKCEKCRTNACLISWF